MNVLVVSGGRNPEGQTAKATSALVKGLVSGGSHVDQICLPSLRMERCRQCEDDGWGTCVKEGHCDIDDSFGRIVEEIKRADAVVFATPVYFGDLSESLRAFLDRLRRTCMNEEGKKGINGKPVIGVCVAGGGGGGAPNCAVRLEYALQTCGFDVLDLEPVRRQNIKLKTTTLEIVGQWLASDPKN